MLRARLHSEAVSDERDKALLVEFLDYLDAAEHLRLPASAWGDAAFDFLAQRAARKPQAPTYSIPALPVDAEADALVSKCAAARRVPDAPPIVRDLQDEGGYGLECDWGDCGHTAVKERQTHDGKWLPVCACCAKKPEPPLPQTASSRRLRAIVVNPIEELLKANGIVNGHEQERALREILALLDVYPPRVATSVPQQFWRVTQTFCNFEHKGYYLAFACDREGANVARLTPGIDHGRADRKLAEQDGIDSGLPPWPGTRSA